MSSDEAIDEYFNLVYSANVNKYKFVDCPNCGILGKFRAITNDERNEFLHGSSKLLPMMLDVAGGIAQSVVRKGLWGTAASVAQGMLEDGGALLRFMRCTACLSVILVCPHCGKLMAGSYYHKVAVGGALRCQHCSNKVEG